MSLIVVHATCPNYRLVATWYDADFVDELPLTELGLTVGPGRTHRHFTGTPEFAFGTGLSFSEWELNWSQRQVDNPAVRWSTSQDPNAIGATLELAIANVGGMPTGRRTVMVFVRPTDGNHPKLLQKLIEYGGLANVARWEQASLHFSLKPADLALADDAGNMVLYPGSYEVVVRDGSSELVRTLTLKGDLRVLQRFPGQ